MFSSGILSVLALSVVSVFGYDANRADNVRQNSFGAAGGAQSGWQQQIGTYCQDDVINVLPIAFVDVFFSTGGLPDLNMANVCSAADNGVFAGTGLANCQFLASQIQACQAAGKLVTISLGGASGAAVLSSDAQGVQLANTIWNIFLGGSSSTRPFGAAVLDGLDLDIEGGSATGFSAFVTEIRALSAGATKNVPFPDACLGSVLNAVAFDAVYVQVSSSDNKHDLKVLTSTQDWDFDSWDTWAKTVSPNKNVKIFIGAPASSSAGAGYISAAALGQLAVSTRAQFSSFGGIMLWDASQAYANGRFDKAVKSIITTAGGGGVTTTSTSTRTSSTTSATSTKTTSTTSTKTTTSSTSTTTTVTSGSCAGVAGMGFHSGGIAHLWQANWWSEADVPGGASGDWADLGACTALAATVKAATIATAKVTLTDVAHSEETAKTKGNSRAFRF
ncbi:glycoside hydrolase [Mycena amicta]|nr:glycoside hydrolase [Mycena amicta]